MKNSRIRNLKALQITRAPIYFGPLIFGQLAPSNEREIKFRQKDCSISKKINFMI